MRSLDWPKVDMACGGQRPRLSQGCLVPICGPEVITQMSLIQAMKPVGDPVYQFPIVAITNSHKFSSLKNKQNSFP